MAEAAVGSLWNPFALGLVPAVAMSKEDSAHDANEEDAHVSAAVAVGAQWMLSEEDTGGEECRATKRRCAGRDSATSDDRILGGGELSSSR